jgi:hypothetical protein
MMPEDEGLQLPMQMLFGGLINQLSPSGSRGVDEERL